MKREAKKEEHVRSAEKANPSFIDLEMEDISESQSRELPELPKDEYRSLPNSANRPSRLVRQHQLKTKYRKKIQKERPIKLSNCWLYPIKQDGQTDADEATPKLYVVSSTLLDKDEVGVTNVDITVNGDTYLFVSDK